MITIPMYLRGAAVGAVGLIAALMPGVPASSASGRPARETLTIANGVGPTVVSGLGCNWPEGELYGPGSSVGVVVINWFTGGGQTSTPVTLGETEVIPSSDGGWEYLVPRAPLAEVPPWATEVIIEAQAGCHQSIGNGFDYDPVESRRTIERPSVGSTTAPSSPAPTTTPAVPAEPVATQPSFTG